MTEAPKLPKRRRRKIIAALLLAFASLVSWWHWRRGDARFVGKWHTLFIAPGVVVAQKECVIELRSSGRATIAYSDGSSRSFAWTTDGDKFIEGWPTTWRPVNEIVGFPGRGIGSKASSAYWVTNKIETEAGNAFELCRPVTYRRAKFTRLPE